MTDVLMNFDQSFSSSIGSLPNNIVRESYVIHLMLVFPLLNFSLRANLDELLFLLKISLFLGSTSTVSIAFIFPAAIVLRFKSDTVFLENWKECEWYLNIKREGCCFSNACSCGCHKYHCFTKTEEA
ncbi:unnamed protein product [Eruca vesicaria subsp. sativa]|uniref:Uncharacterized protein n=1 Tax=Eruca vesicaria subsp. sativa TaxID=29727 RepID=A0ABC8L1Q5_ERUVS|nr:unnamed protein product [Eruca vesicaria subsp. sativa]